MKEPSPRLINVNLRIEKVENKGLMAGGKGLLKKQMEIELNN